MVAEQKMIELKLSRIQVSCDRNIIDASHESINTWRHNIDTGKYEMGWVQNV